MSKSVRVDVALDAGTNSCFLAKGHIREEGCLHTRGRWRQYLEPFAIVFAGVAGLQYYILVPGRTRVIDTTEAKHSEEQEG
jgi:hypothetical protein